MKKLIIATILFAVSAPSQAYVPPFELCMQIHDAAHVTMRLRQMNDSKQEILKLATNDSLKTMVNDAYKVRVFNSDYLKSEAADRFADEYFDRCLDNDF